MLHMPTPMLMSPAVAKTYPQFAAHVIALTAGRSYSWTNGVFADSPQVFRTTVGAATGDMAGSPWMASFGTLASGNSSIVARVVQHSLPSPEVFAALVAAGSIVLVEVVGNGIGDLVGLTRNGYTSSTATARDTGKVTRVLYWFDGPWIIDPSTGAAPIPYDWSI